MGRKKADGLKGRRIKKAAILLFWLCLWQGISLWVDRPIFLVGPCETLAAIFRLAGTGPFWHAVFSSLARIGFGFALAFCIGLICGSAAYFRPFFGELLSPVVTLMKTIPVASFVILALIWAGADNLSLIISFLVVFPIIYLNTVAGLKSTDRQLLEMSQVYRMKSLARALHIYRPALAPYLVSACQVALGMSWKSGIAAEVIGTPQYSIGENLYMAKVFFTTDELFAWTAVIIALSFLFEKAVLILIKEAAREKI